MSYQLQSIIDPQHKQSLVTCKTRIINTLVPRVAEIFKAIGESIDANLDMCIVSMSYLHPSLPDYASIEDVIANIFSGKFRMNTERSLSCTQIYALANSGVAWQNITEEKVGFKGLAELRLRWQPEQREFIRKRLDIKHLVEIEKAEAEEAAAKEKIRVEAEKRAKDDELANYQRHISDYRKKQAAAQAGSEKANPQQRAPIASGEPPVDQLLDTVVSIRDELRVLQRTQAMLTSEKASVVNVGKSIAELRKRLAATVAALNEAVNTGK